MDSLNGILFKDWRKLLKDNQYKIAPSFFGKILGLTILSINNSKDYKNEKNNFEQAIKDTSLVQDPIFVLGHWRSGTTFLHNVLSQDKQFAYANIFEIRNPHTFLTRQPIFELRKQQSAEARPTDNVQIDFTSPGEEEFAVAILSKLSPLFGWVFPQNADKYDKYDKYDTFESCTSEEKETWKDSMHFYLQKLTYLYKKQLMLKSPLNTGKIQMLLELYPNAKFINIHRNPYHVFQSTKRMYETAVAGSAFNASKFDDLESVIIKNYKKMYNAFFAQQPNIPKENYTDVSFETLEQKPQAVVEKIYNDLNLAGYEQAQDKIAGYLNSLNGYKKNKHVQLDESISKQIIQEWKMCFDAWNYEIV